MADLSNSSFIPKRGPVKRSKTSSTRKVYLFTLMSYTLMFATLLGAGGMFFYSKYIESQLTKEVSLLNDEIASFDESKMQRVLDFDLRLRQAVNRIDNSASVLSILEAMEATTIETVSLESLTVSRDLDTGFGVETVLATDSFDSTIFQRGVYNRYKSVVDSVLVEISQVAGLDSSGDSTRAQEVSDSGSVVKAEVMLDIPLSSVPYVPRENSIATSELQVTEDVSVDADLPETNQESL